MLETLQGGPEQHSFVVAAATLITVKGNFLFLRVASGLTVQSSGVQGPPVSPIIAALTARM